MEYFPRASIVDGGASITAAPLTADGVGAPLKVSCHLPNVPRAGGGNAAAEKCGWHRQALLSKRADEQRAPARVRTEIARRI